MIYLLFSMLPIWILISVIGIILAIIEKHHRAGDKKQTTIKTVKNEMHEIYIDSILATGILISAIALPFLIFIDDFIVCIAIIAQLILGFTIILFSGFIYRKR